jgi:sugar lactone lactonase YvrE
MLASLICVSGCLGADDTSHGTAVVLASGPAPTATAQSKPTQHVPGEPHGNLALVTGPTGVKGLRDGKGSASQFNEPGNVAIDVNGNLYVLDEGNSAVRKVTPNGTVTTLATIVGFTQSNLSEYPNGIAVDRKGNVFVSDATNDLVWKITPDGSPRVYAGTGGVAKHKDGPAGGALFSSPSGLLVDGADMLYVADAGNNAVRKITPDGIVTTPIGGKAGFADGPIATARFAGPWGLAMDKDGNLYVAETTGVEDEGRGEYACAIRKVGVDGKVSTLGENAYNEVRHTGNHRRFPSITLHSPSSIAADGSGFVYYLWDGNISRLATTPPAIKEEVELLHLVTDRQSAGCQGFSSIAIDALDDIYGSSGPEGCIIKVSQRSLKLSVIAGGPDNSRIPVDVDEWSQQLEPRAVKTDPSGNLFVEFDGKRTIRKVSPDGQISERLNRVVDDGSVKQFPVPPGPVDAAGRRLFRATDLSRALGVDIDFSGQPPDGSFSINPHNGAFAVDAQQNLYLVAWCSKTRSVCAVKVSPEGKASVLVGAYKAPVDLTVDALGNVYVYDIGANTNSISNPKLLSGRVDHIVKIAPDGTSNQFADVTMDADKNGRIMHRETGFLVSSSGDIYLADESTVRRIDGDGTVVVLAGSGTEMGYVDGQSSTARFNGINGIARSESGSIFVSESGNNAVRELSTDGTVTTLVNGKGEGRVHYDPATIGPLSDVRGLALLPNGQLVILNRLTVLRTE